MIVLIAAPFRLDNPLEIIITLGAVYFRLGFVQETGYGENWNSGQVIQESSGTHNGLGQWPFIAVGDI
jgi:hypothetical protein